MLNKKNRREQFTETQLSTLLYCVKQFGDFSNVAEKRPFSHKSCNIFC